MSAIIGPLIMECVKDRLLVEDKSTKFCMLTKRVLINIYFSSVAKIMAAIYSENSSETTVRKKLVQLQRRLRKRHTSQCSRNYHIPT